MKELLFSPQPKTTTITLPTIMEIDMGNVIHVENNQSEDIKILEGATLRGILLPGEEVKLKATKFENREGHIQFRWERL